MTAEAAPRRGEPKSRATRGPPRAVVIFPVARIDRRDPRLAVHVLGEEDLAARSARRARSPRPGCPA